MCTTIKKDPQILVILLVIIFNNKYNYISYNETTMNLMLSYLVGIQTETNQAINSHENKILEITIIKQFKEVSFVSFENVSSINPLSSKNNLLVREATAGI